MTALLPGTQVQLTLEIPGADPHEALRQCTVFMTGWSEANSFMQLKMWRLGSTKRPRWLLTLNGKGGRI